MAPRLKSAVWLASFLTFAFFWRCEGQCNFNALDGSQWLYKIDSQGRKVLFTYDDTADTITFTADGVTTEIWQCIAENPALGLYVTRLHTVNRGGVTVNICTKGLAATSSFAANVFEILETNASLTVAECDSTLLPEPCNMAIALNAPVANLAGENCGLVSGSYHAVFGSTSPQVCSDDPFSAYTESGSFITTDTCFSGPPSHEYPHHAELTCYTQIASPPLSQTFTIAGATIDGVTDFYCASKSTAGGNDVVTFSYRENGPLKCCPTTNNPTLSLTLLSDHCELGACQNGASCQQDSDGFTCTCVPGYTGIYCETEIDECASSPCQNGGTCHDELNAFSCTCPTGFEGGSCETDINECLQDPCINGGTCRDLPGMFVCTCPAGFTGISCNEEINECTSQPCLHGDCTDLDNAYSCTCNPGFEGDNCEINIDECASDPCTNGRCEDLDNKYVCVCPPGYTGVHCDEDLDECESSPCGPNGECTDGSNSYECSCKPGFTGDMCHINIDDCINNRCVNGECLDGIETYTCDCAPGFIGQFCELVAPTTPKPPKVFPQSILDQNLIAMLIAILGVLAAIMMLVCVCMLRGGMARAKGMNRM